MSIFAALLWHTLASFAAGAFYAPISKIKHWSWETSWILMGIFAWVLLPWGISYFLIDDFSAFYKSISARDYIFMIFFGMMWGIGNVSYGLTMRYLGLALGGGIAIGTTMIVGSLLPLFVKGQFIATISTLSGIVAMLGVIVAVVGVWIVTNAGILKEHIQRGTAKEFSMKKGIPIAIICGIFSSGFAFGLEFAGTIQENALDLGINPLYALLPSYGIIMGGGAVINFLFCIVRLNTNPNISFKKDLAQPKNLLMPSALLAISAGVCWYLQFFFYSWGVANVPAELGFINWMLHMSIYVLSVAVVGLLLSEWKGIGGRPLRMLWLGIIVIIIASNIVGIGMALQ
ncbi:MAG: L-rhamnose/proton symporter RhaT [Alphaproteobacteria bacterium]|jgi:L-rhamnose-H+ transport protein|nr:L-rhamnose/proton symporter RhaT [Alphaproteobacteria bacterium]